MDIDTKLDTLKTFDLGTPDIAVLPAPNADLEALIEDYIAKNPGDPVPNVTVTTDESFTFPDLQILLASATIFRDPDTGRRITVAAEDLRFEDGLDADDMSVLANIYGGKTGEFDVTGFTEALRDGAVSVRQVDGQAVISDVDLSAISSEALMAAAYEAGTGLAYYPTRENPEGAITGVYFEDGTDNALRADISVADLAAGLAEVTNRPGLADRERFQQRLAESFRADDPDLTFDEMMLGGMELPRQSEQLIVRDTQPNNNQRLRFGLDAPEPPQPVAVSLPVEFETPVDPSPVDPTLGSWDIELPKVPVTVETPVDPSPGPWDIERPEIPQFTLRDLIKSEDDGLFFTTK